MATTKRLWIPSKEEIQQDILDSSKAIRDVLVGVLEQKFQIMNKSLSGSMAEEVGRKTDSLLMIFEKRLGDVREAYHGQIDQIEARMEERLRLLQENQNILLTQIKTLVESIQFPVPQT